MFSLQLSALLGMLKVFEAREEILRNALVLAVRALAEGEEKARAIAGYYDGPPERIRDWLAIGGPTGGIRGAMYTTWRHNFDDLERFAQAAWGAGP